MNVYIEALIVGIILLIISVPIMGVVNTYMKNFGQWKFYTSTVLIGFLTHILFEFSGVNKWYCTNGSACKKKGGFESIHPASL